MDEYNKANIPTKFPKYSFTYLENLKNLFKYLLMRNKDARMTQKVISPVVQTFTSWRDTVIVFLGQDCLSKYN